MQKQIFSIPNIDKNVRLQEEESGLRMFYTLPSTESFPYKTFQSKNKWYYRTELFIPYNINMSKRIHFAYMYLKSRSMLVLAEWKQVEINNKVNDLKELTLQFKTYK